MTMACHSRMLLSLWHTSLVVIEVGGHPNFGGACQFLKQNVFPITLQLTSLQSATQTSSVKSSKSDKVLCRLVQCQQQTPHKIKYHSSKSKWTTMKSLCDFYVQHPPPPQQSLQRYSTWYLRELPTTRTITRHGQPESTKSLQRGLFIPHTTTYPYR